MEGEIIRSEAPTLSRRAQLSRAALQEEVEQRTLLGQYVKACMVEGTDYGKIPGTEKQKPTLLKPGAEKLIALFHCEPRFELVKEFCETNFETGFFKYTFRCVIGGPNGATLAEGYGSANSREARYRWRDGKRKCPECGHGEALLKSKKEPGFFCWEKKGGCGANFGPEDSRITEQQVGKVENPDIADLDNTILKMAKKRAQVDAAIALARCSDMFTQDVEDFASHDVPAVRGDSPPSPRDEPPAQPAQKAEKKGAKQKALTEADPVGYGPPALKSKPIAQLSPAEARELLNLGAEKIGGAPNNPWWGPAVKRAMALIVQSPERVSHEDVGIMIDTCQALAANEEASAPAKAAALVLLSVLEPEAERRAQQSQ